MKDRYQRIGSVAMISLLVLTAVVSPFFSAPAAAASDDGWQEEATETACAAGGIVVTLFTECNVEYGDVDGATADQVWWDIYSDGVFMYDSRDQHITQQLSYIEQTQGIAMAYAKKEIVQCMNNGNSQAVCEDRARQEVTKVFAEVQKSIYISQNRQMKHWQMMNQQVNQTDNLARTDVYPIAGSTSFSWIGPTQKEVQLYNGKTINVTVGSYKYDTRPSVVGGYTTIALCYYDGSVCKSNPYDPDNDGYGNLNVESPDGSTTIALDSERYKKSLTTLDKKYQDALSAVHPMANSIYSNYEPGEVSASEMSGPLETMLTSATNDDPLTYRLKSALMAGYAVQTDGKTVKVKADFNNDGTIGTDETKTGVIYADDGAFPSNKVATTTYKPSDTNGSVTFISNPDGATPEDYQLGNKQFAVQTIYTENGSKTNSMELTTNDFATTETSDLNKQINEIENQLEKLEKSYGSDSTSFSFGGLSGGISSFLNEFGTALLAILALLAGAWFLKS